MVSSVMVFAGKNGYGFPSGGGRYRIGMDTPAITGHWHAQGPAPPVRTKRSFRSVLPCRRTGRRFSGRPFFVDTT